MTPSQRKELKKLGDFEGELIRTNKDARGNWHTLEENRNVKGAWIGLDSINPYCALVQAEAKRLGKNCLIYSTEKNSSNSSALVIGNEKYFFTRLAKDLERPLEADQKILFPILMGISFSKKGEPRNTRNNHWAAGEIDFKSGKIHFYTSLEENKKTEREVLKQLEKIQKKLKAEYPEKSWKIITDSHLHREDFPMQMDGGNNCGVFACKFIEWRMLDRTLESRIDTELFMKHLAVEEISDTDSVDPDDVTRIYPTVREEMLVEIMRGKLRPIFAE